MEHEQRSFIVIDIYFILHEYKFLPSMAYSNHDLYTIPRAKTAQKQTPCHPAHLHKSSMEVFEKFNFYENI